MLDNVLYNHGANHFKIFNAYLVYIGFNFMPRKKSNLLKISEPQMGYALDFANTRVKSRPFIKWAGGKSQLLPDMSKLFPPKQQIGRYFEPFLGGAAVFFYLQHPKSFLSDSNEELIELYKAVQQNV